MIKMKYDSMLFGETIGKKLDKTIHSKTPPYMVSQFIRSPYS